MFPEYRDLISRLKTTDAHFAKLFTKHNQLDHDIKQAETSPGAEFNSDIATMKKEKLKLKDMMYEILKKYDEQLTE